MAFLERCLQCFGGCGILEVLAVFWRVWHFGGVLAVFWWDVAFWRGACNILEGCGIFGEVPAMFWRDVAFWMCLQCFGVVWPFWRALAVCWSDVAFLEGACSVLEGCGLFGGRLQCFGGM